MEAGAIAQKAKNHPIWTAFLVIVALLAIYALLFVVLGTGSGGAGEGSRLPTTPVTTTTK